MTFVTYLDVLRRLVREKRAEIARLEGELRSARDALRSLEESTGTMERADHRARTRSGDPDAGDLVIAIREMIVAAGRPLFIDEILHGLGERLTREARLRVRELVLERVDRGEIFTRPRPGTYGVVELQVPRQERSGE